MFSSLLLLARGGTKDERAKCGVMKSGAMKIKRDGKERRLQTDGLEASDRGISKKLVVSTVSDQKQMIPGSGRSVFRCDRRLIM